MPILLIKFFVLYMGLLYLASPTRERPSAL